MKVVQCNLSITEHSIVRDNYGGGLVVAGGMTLLGNGSLFTGNHGGNILPHGEVYYLLPAPPGQSRGEDAHPSLNRARLLTD